MATSSGTQMSKIVHNVKACVFSRRQTSVCATGALYLLSRSRLCTTPSAHSSEHSPTVVPKHEPTCNTQGSMSSPNRDYQNVSVDRMAMSEDTKGRCEADRKLLEKRFGWMGDHVPCFGVKGDNITVIEAPVDFYETLKSMVQSAEKRIVIASLYLGTGELEKQLVEAIETAIQRNQQNPTGEKLEIHMLFDYHRGSRGTEKSSRTMLLPLLEKYGDLLNVYLYHTPELNGWLKQIVPERFNEVVGLQHMKVYLTDDDFIISGANLSEQYFINRQDRFIHFRGCPEMANYLTDLVKTVSTFSFHLNSNNSTSYPSNSPHPYEGHASDFKEFARNAVIKLSSNAKSQNKDSGAETCKSESSEVDTWLFPLIQMGQLNIDEDEVTTKKLFTNTEKDDKVYLTSGYFNLTREYMDVLLDNSKAEFDILSAAPEANGFFNASGVSYYVPMAYTHISQQFYKQLCDKCQTQRITLHEYLKPHWTFHCKGLWYYLPNCTLPSLTFIGSPNFGYRSVYRDLECQVAVMTTNPSLQQQLKKEHEHLYGLSTQVTEKTFQKTDRYVPLWARFVTGIINHFF